MAVRAAFRDDRWQPRRAWPGFRPAADEPIPRLNLSGRYYFNDDLSLTKGRHNFKAGLSLEYNRKTEPGSADYMGNFNFGHNANNPLSTGNGYANMLLGVFTTYTELTSRVDRDVRHWQNDFYLQDNWRVTPRLTVDYGVRVQHSGSDFEVNNMNSGFFTDLWQRGEAARVYRLDVHHRRAWQPGLRRRGTSARSIRPTRACSSRPRTPATSCRARASRSTGSSPAASPGKKPGHVLHVPVLHLRAARRAWPGT